MSAQPSQKRITKTTAGVIGSNSRFERMLRESGALDNLIQQEEIQLQHTIKQYAVAIAANNCLGPSLPDSVVPRDVLITRSRAQMGPVLSPLSFIRACNDPFSPRVATLALLLRCRDGSREAAPGSPLQSLTMPCAKERNPPPAAGVGAAALYELKHWPHRARMDPCPEKMIENTLELDTGQFFFKPFNQMPLVASNFYFPRWFFSGGFQISPHLDEVTKLMFTTLHFVCSLVFRG